MNSAIESITWHHWDEEDPDLCDEPEPGFQVLVEYLATDHKGKARDGIERAHWVPGAAYDMESGNFQTLECANPLVHQLPAGIVGWAYIITPAGERAKVDHCWIRDTEQADECT